MIQKLRSFSLPLPLSPGGSGSSAPRAVMARFLGGCVKTISPCVAVSIMSTIGFKSCIAFKPLGAGVPSAVGQTEAPSWIGGPRRTPTSHLQDFSQQAASVDCWHHSKESSVRGRWSPLPTYATQCRPRLQRDCYNPSQNIRTTCCLLSGRRSQGGGEPAAPGR